MVEYRKPTTKYRNPTTKKSKPQIVDLTGVHILDYDAWLKDADGKFMGEFDVGDGENVPDKVFHRISKVDQNWNFVDIGEDTDVHVIYALPKGIIVKVDDKYLTLYTKEEILCEIEGLQNWEI